MKRFRGDRRGEGLTQRFEPTTHQLTLQQAPHAAARGSSAARWTIP